MGYGRTVLVDHAFEETVSAVKDALGAKGFGVLTEIDVRATLKERLDVDTDPFVILGACSPRLAHRALELEPDVGLMLPCNVVVRIRGEKTLVSAVDPEIIADLGDHPELKGVAEEASGLLDAALDRLVG